MADKTGYIGRNPNDSAVTVARQFFTASGVTTNFTFTSGYLTGYLDVYVDGVKKRVSDEFTATDGSTFDVLQGGVSAGSTVEAVAYKAFNAAAISGDITGNFDVSGNSTLGGSLSVTGGTTLSNLNVTGIATLGAGTTVAFANTAFNLSGTPDITIASLSAVDINVSGAATIGGILTYEDVTNIDSVGIVTARTGVEVTANGLVVNAGVSTFAADVSIADKIVHTGDTNTAIRFPSADTITAETAGVERVRIDSNGDVGLVGIATATGLVVVAGSGVYAGHTGIITAVTFDGNISGGTVSGSTGTFTGDVDIADKIVHTGDANTAIRFPSADTFTVETSGTERLRVGSTGTVGVAGLSTATSFGAFNHLSAPFGGGTVSYTVTVGSKTANHRYNGTGSSNGYLIDGVEAPFLTLTPGRTYRFVHDNTGSHPLKFYLEADKTTLYSTGVTFDNAYTEIVVSDSTPTILHYQCTNHGYMGNSVQVNSNISGGLVGTPDIDCGTGSFTGDVDIADKIIHTGDTNTAIRFPAADTFTVETGGDEALRVDSSQRVLLGRTSNFTGTNAQYGLLQISGNSAGATGDGRIVIGRGEVPSAGNQSLGQINFVDNTAGEFASIKAFTDGSCGTDDYPGRIEFHTTADAASSPVERLRIDSSGDVHIGDSSSNANGHGLLSLTQNAAAAFNALVIQQGNTGFTATDGLHIGIDANVDAYFKLFENRDFIFYTGSTNTEALRIDTSQRLLIGTSTEIDSSTASNLQIANASGPRICVARNDTSVTGGNLMGAIDFYGNDSNGTYELCGRMILEADGTHDDDDKPTRMAFYTTPSGSDTATERLRITNAGHVSLVGDNQKLLIGAGDDIEIYHDGSASYIHDNGTGDLNICMESGSKFVIQSGTSGNHLAEFNYEGAAELFHNGSQKLETTSSGVTVTGAVTDSKGDVRDIPMKARTSAYTLVIGDAGKFIRITTGGVTVPSGVFSTGDAVTIYNHSGSDQTITQGSSVTLRSAGTADTGNRTLAQRGACTVLCVDTNEFVISGAGLS